jgi:DNA-binding NarL/FixJ family response regulator
MTLSSLNRGILGLKRADSGAESHARKAVRVERRYRVLALDDSELIHAKLRMLFRSEPSVEITCTAKWTDVVESCRCEKPPDLLILDLNMPEVRGEIVGMGVRSSSDAIPIVIFSSESDSRLELAMRTTGARAAVAKSDGERLVGEVMNLLRATC